VADGDIVLRDPGGSAGDISFGGTAPVAGTADVDLPSLGAAATGLLSFVGTASAALQPLAASGAAVLTFSGQAATSLLPLEADVAAALLFSGAASASLPALTADGNGALIFAALVAAMLPSPDADGTVVLAFSGIADVDLVTLAAEALGEIEVESDGAPGNIRIGVVEPLCRIVIEPVEPLCTIRVEAMSKTHHVGDIAEITFETLNSDGERADPGTLTIRVRRVSPTIGSVIPLVYGVAPSVEGGDAVIRISEGYYAAHFELTSARGAGDYVYSIVATGAVIAAEPGSFRVFPLPV
jgi:hypothetical protein